MCPSPSRVRPWRLNTQHHLLLTLHTKRLQYQKKAGDLSELLIVLEHAPPLHAPPVQSAFQEIKFNTIDPPHRCHAE